MRNVARLEGVLAPIWEVFGKCLGTLLDCFGAPLEEFGQPWGDHGSLEFIKRLQEAPQEGPKRGPRGAPEAPRGLQEASKSALEVIWGTIFQPKIGCKCTLFFEALLETLMDTFFN